MNKLQKRMLSPYCGLMLFLISGVTFAQPKISGIEPSQNADITIKGNFFGKGPNIVLYDNFDRATVVGDKLNLEPQIGDWNDVLSSSPSLYRDGEDDLSLLIRGASYTRLIFGIEDAAGVNGLKMFQEIYFSYSIRDLGEFPGDGGAKKSFSHISSTKDAWMMLGNRGDNTAWAMSRGWPDGNDLYIPAWTGGGFNIAGNNTGMKPSFWQHELTKNWDFGGWNSSMFHAELDPSNPYGPAEGFFSFINKNRFHINIRTGNLIEDLRSEGVPYPAWDRIKFNAWLKSGDANVQRLLDEVYVAIGPNSNARVLAIDAESIEEATVAHHLMVDQWTSSEIAASLPEHILKNTNKKFFVIVLDSENRASKAVPLCTQCPRSPNLQLSQ